MGKYRCVDLEACMGVENGFLWLEHGHQEIEGIIGRPVLAAE